MRRVLLLVVFLAYVALLAVWFAVLWVTDKTHRAIRSVASIRW